ncbi:hypothetical protein C8Q80DRAFT_1276333 [Daedaleopsis nitida]|nr:hypothetical protein C8Q80DRAFT_1276333 [Daedaleopsis nitida]
MTVRNSSTTRSTGWNAALVGYSPQQREEAWKSCATAVERHYEERLKRWNAELDMLLVFAGLFSTALTAFIVQSYPLLQPDNTDTVVLALTYLSNQIDSFSISSTFVNSTQGLPFAPAADASFTVPRHAVWINALWFSSLVCTLSASAIAVLVKQWLHQYSQSLSGMSPEVARLRQYRYDSMLKWRVPEIMAALPMLLQAALALFLTGLLILLWTLHPSVAIAATIPIGVLIVFISATTLLPIFYSDCCYQSPQALSVLLGAQYLARVSSKVLKIVERLAHQSALAHQAALAHRSALAPQAARAHASTTLAQQSALEKSWTSRKYVLFARIRDGTRAALKRMAAMGSFRSWNAREKPDAEARHSELEQSLALTAYYITLDKSMLNTTVIPYLSEMDALSARMSIRYGELLRDVTDKFDCREWKVWRPIMPFVLVVLSLITNEPKKGTIRKVLLAMPPHPLSPAKSKLGMLYLLAMSQLVVRRIAAREAFQNILAYLQYARIDAEDSVSLGSSVLEDVESTFPVKPAEFEELLDLDRFESVSHYLTGVEYSIKYLLRHRTRLEAASIRAQNVLRSFKLFLHSPLWRIRRTRLEAVLWALLYSQLPALLQELNDDVDTAILVTNDLIEGYRDAITILEQEFEQGAAGHTIGQTASQGARWALTLIKRAFSKLENAVNVQKSASAEKQRDGKAASIPDGHPSHDREGPPPQPDPASTSEQHSIPFGSSAPGITFSASHSTSVGDASEVLDPQWIEMLDTWELEPITVTNPSDRAGQSPDEFPDSPLPDPFFRKTSPLPSEVAPPPPVAVRPVRHFGRARNLSLYNTLPLPPLPVSSRRTSIVQFPDISQVPESIALTPAAAGSYPHQAGAPIPPDEMV